MHTYIYIKPHPSLYLLLGYWHLSVLLDFLGFRIGGRRHPPPFICSDSYKLYPLLGFLILFWAALGTLCSVQSWPLVRPEDSILQFSFEFLVSLLLGDMDERIPPPPFFQYSPSGVHSFPHHHNSMRYLAELLAERQKLAPFMQVLPFCNRLLNQEILRASSLPPNPNFVEPERINYGSPSPLRLAGHPMNGQPMDLDGWSGMQTEYHGVLQSPSTNWNGTPEAVGSPTVKKVVRMDVPVDKYPNYNFVGRLLGPRGNSLKRVEATTQCRVYIRGRGSVKDSVKEDKLRDKPGYEHLNDPLHVLVEAEFPADIVDARLNQAVAILEDLLKPVDESMDYYKKQQLRELAILNGTLREESPSSHLSPSVSPFNSTGMKRAKTGR